MTHVDPSQAQPHWPQTAAVHATVHISCGIADRGAGEPKPENSGIEDTNNNDNNQQTRARTIIITGIMKLKHAEKNINSDNNNT